MPYTVPQPFAFATDERHDKVRAAMSRTAAMPRLASPRLASPCAPRALVAPARLARRTRGSNACESRCGSARSGSAPFSQIRAGSSSATDPAKARPRAEWDETII
jgi:hypothetical protein